MRRAFAFATVILAFFAAAAPMLFAGDGAWGIGGADAAPQPGFWPAHINVTVTDSIGNKIPNAIVKLAGNATDFVTNGGGFTIIDVEAESQGTDFVLWANKTGYLNSSAQEPLRVIGNETKNTTRMILGSKILGTVVASSPLAAPIVGANVSISELNYTVKTSPEGSYRLEVPNSRGYNVTANATGYIQKTKKVEVGVADSVQCNFALLSQNGSIKGVVKSGNLLLVKVNVSIAGTSFFNLSAADGSYEIDNLTAGTYTVNATKEGYRPFSQTVVIPPGSATELLINLTAMPGAVLRGVVVSAEEGHEPLSYVLVTIKGQTQSPVTVLSNIKGEFEFTGLIAGNYTLELEREGYRPVSSGRIIVEENKTTEMNFQLMPIRHGFAGFIFGFDMAHSMMILALFLTIVILAMAVYLRIRTFQAPETAPAVYDEEEEPAKEAAPNGAQPDSLPPAADNGDKKNGGA